MLSDTYLLGMICVTEECNYDLCGLPKIDFCCNYFEVLHLCKLPASAYFIQYRVRGGAFDLAAEVTQVRINYTGRKKTC